MSLARYDKTIAELAESDRREVQSLATSRGLSAGDILMQEVSTGVTWDDIVTVPEYERVYRYVRFTAKNYKHLLMQLLHFVDFTVDPSQGVVRVYDSPNVSGDGSYKQWSVEIYSNITQQVRLAYYVRCPDSGMIITGGL